MDNKEYAHQRLFSAAERGNFGAARAALNAGADVNAKNSDDETPLHLAAWGGHADIAKLLIENGADVNAKDNCYQTPLMVAWVCNHTNIVELLKRNASKEPGHAARVTKDRSDKGPSQVGG